MKMKGYLETDLEKKGGVFDRGEDCIVSGELEGLRRQYKTRIGLEVG